MLNKLKALLQLLLPKQLLTELAGWLASKQLSFFTTWIIKLFIKAYKVNLNEAKFETAEEYSTFNDFFIRELKPNMRPIDDAVNSVVSPADGTISQFGTIKHGELLQAKGHLYSLDSLLGCDQKMVDLFQDGFYLTTYLSPKDYHRVHMPFKAELKEMRYIPGSLFSVNQATTENIENIFARNERVITLFETEYGPMIQILVGATIVGSIRTAWLGESDLPRDGLIKGWNYAEGQESFEKGEEMGAFKFGSTVINLFVKDHFEFNPELTTGESIKMGELIGNFK